MRAIVSFSLQRKLRTKMRRTQFFGLFPAAMLFRETCWLPFWWIGIRGLYCGLCAQLQNGLKATCEGECEVSAVRQVRGNVSSSASCPALGDD